MGFPPALWFGDAEERDALDVAVVAALEDETLRAMLEESARMNARERRLLLGIAREIAPHGAGG